MDESPVFGNKKAFQRKACNKECYTQLVFVGDRKIV